MQHEAAHPRLLGRACPRHHLGRRGEDRLEDEPASAVRRRPVEKVGAQRAFEHEARLRRELGGSRAGSARRVCERHEQDHRGRALRMSQRELHRGRRAGGHPDDRGALDSKRVQQACVSIGLRGGRWVFRQRRAQVPETRHGDHLEAARGELVSDAHGLIEPAAGPMDEQHRRTAANRRELDGSARRVEHLAATGDAIDLAAQVALIREPRV